MKVLQVIDQAFRTTVEEQDDTILWLTRSMRGAGGDLQVLLSGHGVHYAVLSQRQPPLELGNWKQSQPAELLRDLTDLTESGVPIFVVREDLEERGLANLPLQAGVELVSQTGLVDLYQQADQIWQW
ncbi:DsrE family protein [Alcanivorax sp. 24]|uniref:DsrE family protein n=1 Tax=Alcanivorax sp. 24 TaxID=2545266 RepID=UPI00105D8FEC|nr:DsrE family protein [Alcanivorax sp. 24]